MNLLNLSTDPPLAAQFSWFFKVLQSHLWYLFSSVFRCKSTGDLFTFIKASQRITDPKKGWGRALKKAVQRWFDNRDAMTLAKIMSSQRKSGGYRFLDIMRLAHIKPKTEGKVGYFFLHWKVNLIASDIRVLILILSSEIKLAQILCSKILLRTKIFRLKNESTNLKCSYKWYVRDFFFYYRTILIFRFCICVAYIVSSFTKWKDYQ